MTLAVNAALVVLALQVLRLGVWPTVLVVALIGVLLCHPTVRLFLEFAVPNYLEGDKSTERDEAKKDALHGRLAQLASRERSTVETKGRMDLSSLPTPLQPELAKIMQLVKRDFVQYWYDPITFGDEAFPDEAIASLEHVIAQVSMRLEQFRRANVATELSLTVLSVLVAALRRRRTAQGDIAAGAGLGLWASSEARIESLRTSMSTLLLQSLPHEDRRSPALVTMLTEIFTKQIWETLQSQSDPDVLNQYIVQYGQKSPGTAITAMALGEVPTKVEAVAEKSAAAAMRAPDLASSVLKETPHVASSVTSTLGSAVAVSVPAVAEASEQTAGVLKEAYSALANAAVGEAPGHSATSELGAAASANALDDAKARPSAPRDSVPKPGAARELPAKPSQARESPAKPSQARASPAKPSVPRDRAPVDLLSGPESPTRSLPPTPSSAPVKAPESWPEAHAQAKEDAQAALASSRRSLPEPAASKAPFAEDPMANPWAEKTARKELPDDYRTERPSLPSRPSDTAQLKGGPHEGALIDTDLLDLSDDLQRPGPPALPMDIPKEMKEPPLPPSLQQSKRNSGLAYEPRRSQSPRLPHVRDLLASRDASLLDPFEAYLQQIDPATDRRPEGIALLQLHANLDALVQTADHHSTTPELFESDVRAIFKAAYDALPEHETPPAAPNAQVRAAIRTALDGALTTPAGVEPVQRAVLARLQQLWEASHAPKLKYEPRQKPPSRPSSRTGVARVRSPELARTVSPSADAGITTITVVDVSANAERAGPVDMRTLQVLVSIEDSSSNAGGYVLLRSWAQFEALQAELERMYAQRPADTVLSAPPPPLPSLRAKSSQAACEAIQSYLVALLAPLDGVAWYSTTQAVQRFVDKTRADEEPARIKSANLMTSLGGVGRSFASGVAGAAGTARKGIGQGIGQIGAAAPVAANAPVRIGAGLSRGLFGNKEGRSSLDGDRPLYEVRRERSSFDGRSSEGRAADLPRPPLPTRAKNSQPLERSTESVTEGASDAKDALEEKDANEAKEPHEAPAAKDSVESTAEAHSTTPSAAPSAALVDSDASAKRPLPAPRKPVEKPAPKPAPKPVEKPVASTPASKPVASKPAEKSAPTASKPASEPHAAPLPDGQEEAESLAPQDVDAILTAVFAVVHEAFNLQGSWTLRRGLLRVLEQVVRTTYSTSVVSTLVYFASMLSLPALVSWFEVLRTTLWPNGVWNAESAPPRTPAEKAATAKEAREVVLSYTPTQAAYAIGMGGKQTCMDALATVHDVVTDPVVSLDLHLALVLRVLDLAMGTASGDRGL